MSKIGTSATVTSIKDGTLNSTEVKYQCKTCGAVVVTSNPLENIRQDCCKEPAYEIFAVLTDKTEDEIRTELVDCYEDIVQIFKSFMDMPEQQIKFVAIWIMGTYFHEVFNTYPYLFFNAMRGSGKTRILKLISTLGAKGDGSVQNNLTEAVLFRIPRGTVTCIDEVEQIGSRDKQTLRELLNSAYKKGVKVKRMKKVKKNGEENQVVETFEPYFPIAMANIWGVEEVLADRSVILVLEKSDNPAITKMIENFDTNKMVRHCKTRLYGLSAVSVVSLREKTYIDKWNDYLQYKYNYITTHNNITTLTTHNNTQQHELNETEIDFFNKVDNLGISGRNFELLFPILLVAKHLGNSVFEEILKIGADIVKEKKEEEYSTSKDVSLYEFVCSDWCIQFGLNYISLKEMTFEFRRFLGETDEEDRWLNEKWLGKALKRLNLVLSKKRSSSGRSVMLNYAKAQEKLKIFGKGVQ